jgi:hypothetical protein
VQLFCCAAAGWTAPTNVSEMVLPRSAFQTSEPKILLIWYFVSFTLQKTNIGNWKQIFAEKDLRGHSPHFHIHVSVSDLYIPTIDLPILMQEISGPIMGIYKSLTDT